MDETKFKVIVSDRAKRMLGTHFGFIAKINKNAALFQKKELLDAIKSLDHMPCRFPYFENHYVVSNKYHKMFVRSRYLILYQIKDGTVYVDYILDCRKDYSWLI